MGKHSGFANREMRDLHQRIVAEGWRTRHTGSGHVLCYPPGGGTPVALSTTRVGQRSTMNVRSLLRKAGLDV
jgi:hypothetical protein